jgi:hypothetical protein
MMCLINFLSAQYTYTITADSVKLVGADSSELIIGNHTRAVPGFLFNTGDERTVFQHALVKICDSSYLVGSDAAA